MSSKLVYLDCTLDKKGPHYKKSPDGDRTTPVLCKKLGLSADLARFHLADLPDLKRYLDENRYSVKGVIVSGSALTPTIDDEEVMPSLRSGILNSLVMKTIEHCASKGIPLLGICFAHQLLVRFMEGDSAVVKLGRYHFGAQRIDITPDGLSSTLFASLQNPFFGFEHHGYGAVNDPRYLKVLARSSACIESVQIPDTSVFGVQFHPDFHPYVIGNEGPADLLYFFDSAEDFLRSRGHGENSLVVPSNDFYWRNLAPFKNFLRICGVLPQESPTDASKN